MTIALDQLRVARSFLKQASFLAAGVRGFFSADEQGDLVARMAEIEQRLNDEYEFLGRLAAKIEASIN